MNNSEDLEYALDPLEVQKLAKVDLDFLMALAMPEDYEYALPPAYLAIWNVILSKLELERDFSQIALGWPRGFAKTTLMKLALLYIILYTTKNFILVFGENQDKANNILSDLADFLSEDNIKKVFGDWKLALITDRQDMKVFGFRGRNIVVKAAGAGTGIRGIVLKNKRPDVMLFDDVQSRECADSKLQSSNLETWLYGTAMKAKSPKGCLFLFVANMYPTDNSLLKKIKNNPNWLSFIVGGLLANGESLWEELQPKAQLLKEFNNDLIAGRPEIFLAEVLNDEYASVNNLVDFSTLPQVPYIEGDLHEGNFIIIDPAKGVLGLDAVAIGYFEVFNGKPCLRELKTGSLSPGDTIRESLRLALTHNCRLVAIESVAYQATLAYWFGVVCNQLGITGIKAEEIYPGHSSKNSRILSMFRAYQAGDVFVAPELKATVHLQISQFNPLKTKNVDDILDLLTYSHKVLETFPHEIRAFTLVNELDGNSVDVLDIDYTSSF